VGDTAEGKGVNQAGGGGATNAIPTLQPLRPATGMALPLPYQSSCLLEKRADMLNNYGEKYFEKNFRRKCDSLVNPTVFEKLKKETNAVELLRCVYVS
jgi:hypothetical protein